MDTIHLKNINVSRFILGSNPFSGFSHQGTEMDTAMKRYYTTERVKTTLRQAEDVARNWKD